MSAVVITPSSSVAPPMEALHLPGFIPQDEDMSWETYSSTPSRPSTAIPGKRRLPSLKELTGNELSSFDWPSAQHPPYVPLFQFPPREESKLSLPPPISPGSSADTVFSSLSDDDTFSLDSFIPDDGKIDDEDDFFTCLPTYRSIEADHACLEQVMSTLKDIQKDHECETPYYYLVQEAGKIYLMVKIIYLGASRKTNIWLRYLWNEADSSFAFQELQNSPRNKPHGRMMCNKYFDMEEFNKSVPISILVQPLQTHVINAIEDISSDYLPLEYYQHQEEEEEHILLVQVIPRYALEKKVWFHFTWRPKEEEYHFDKFYLFPEIPHSDAFPLKWIPKTKEAAKNYQSIHRMNDEMKKLDENLKLLPPPDFNPFYDPFWSFRSFPGGFGFLG